MSTPKRHADHRRAASLLVLVMVVLLLWTACAPVGEAQVAKPVLSILQADDSGYPQVQLVVSAADANGIPLPDLTAAQFVLTEDNQPVDILSATEVTGGTPLYVALVLDVSGSMTGAPLQATTRAAQDLVNKLTAVDQAALLTFGTDVVLAAPLSTDHAAISNILQSLRAGGNTLLYDAAHQGVTLLEKTPPGRRAVVLFTDGEDTRSRLTLDDAVAQAQRFAVPLYIVGYGPRIKPAVLTRLAQRTGGAFFQAPRVEDIPTAFAQVTDALRRAYEITYLANARADDRTHEVRVNLTGPGGSVETTGGVTARSGNLSAALKIDGLPDRAAAEQVWQALGNPALDPAIGLISREAVLSPQPTGPGRLVRATFSADGNTLGEATAAPFTHTWDILNVAPGLHTLTVEVEDHVGNRATTQGDVAVIPPAYIAFVEPAENATVTDAVPLTLAVNSVEGEKELLLKADNREVGRIMGSPYTFAWNLRRETEGSHALEASLTTEAGYVATAQRTIRVGPHVVVRIEQPIAGADLAGNVNILADVTSDAPVAEVIFKVAGREVGKATSGAYRASYHTGDFPPGEYTVQVEARNTEGMTGLAEVPVRMTPTSRTSALMVALAGGLLLLLVVPVALLARRRRAARVVPSGIVPVAAAVGDRKVPIAWLVRTGGETPEERYPLYTGENRIGRHRDFADIWLPDTTVSRRQAIFNADPGGIMLNNLNPQNPCMVNGRIVERESMLNDGDAIQIGDITFELRIEQGG
jgi:Ca-activated chloride channel homolog